MTDTSTLFLALIYPPKFCHLVTLNCCQKAVGVSFWTASIKHETCLRTAASRRFLHNVWITWQKTLPCRWSVAALKATYGATVIRMAECTVPSVALVSRSRSTETWGGPYDETILVSLATFDTFQVFLTHLPSKTWTKIHVFGLIWTLRLFELVNHRSVVELT